MGAQFNPKPWTKESVVQATPSEALSDNPPSQQCLPHVKKAGDNPIPSSMIILSPKDNPSQGHQE